MTDNKIKNNKLILLLLYVTCLLLFSCKKEISKYYPNGELYKKYTVDDNGKICGNYFEYYKNGKLKIKHIYSKGILIDSSIYKYPNGDISAIHFHKNKIDYCIVYKNYELKKISHEGFLIHGKKIGKWKYYENNKVAKIFEYIIICGNQYTNQGWCYDKYSRIIKKESNYYTLKKINSKYRIGEKIIIEIKYNPILNEKSISSLFISPDIDKNYCNIDIVKLDTVFSEKNKFTFTVGFKKKGTKYLRGYINEVFNDTINKRNGERKVFFSIPIEII